jgi:hypothetical protein
MSAGEFEGGGLLFGRTPLQRFRSLARLVRVAR